MVCYTLWDLLCYAMDGVIMLVTASTSNMVRCILIAGYQAAYTCALLCMIVTCV